MRIVDGKLGGHLGGHKAVRDAVEFKIVVKGLEVQPYFLGNEVQGGSGHQGAVQVSHKGVKAKAGIRRKLALGRDAGAPGVVLGKEAHVAVVEHAALGRAGGAAGVQQHKEVFGFGVGDRLSLGQARNVPGGQDWSLKAFYQLCQAVIGNEEGAGGVFYHKLQALLGIRGIQRLISAAGLDYAQRGHGGVFTPAQDDGNHVAGLHRLFNMGGQVVGQEVYLLVSQFLIGTGDGNLVRGFLHTLAPEVHHGLIRVSNGWAGVKAVQNLDLGGRSKLQLSNGIGLLEGQYGGSHALCKISEDALRVHVGAVPEAHHVGSLHRGEELHREVEARRIGAQVFSLDPLSRQDQGRDFHHKLALETKVDAGPQAQVSSAVCHGEERTGPQAHRLRLHMVQNFADGRFRCGIHKGGQGVHAHGESRFGRHALAPVPDGGETGGVVCIPRSQRKAEEGGKEDAVGIPVTLQDLPHGGAVQRQFHQQRLIG